jgi:ankyrin repeat protein
MSKSKLPDRASLEYLKKLAKDRLKTLRRANPRTKLASAQLAVARDYGFSSWRSLKAAIEQQQQPQTKTFLDACSKGDLAAMRDLLANDPNLSRFGNEQGWTGLHAAAQAGHIGIVRLLLEHGADPNTRELGDHTYPLHWAAAHGHIEVVRALLDAGGEVHGAGDDHALDVIGWATVFRNPGNNWHEVTDLLLQRGARHHIFSAIATEDLSLIRKLASENSQVLGRRMSRFEHGQTALHFAMSRNNYDILDLLIKLGADLEATDDNGHTALGVAMLRGDREAMRRLHAAGAKQPPGWEIEVKRRGKKPITQATFKRNMADAAGSLKKLVPMLNVSDVARTLEWYAAIGFKELGRFENGGEVSWGALSFGKAELMLTGGGKPGPQNVSLWFYTDDIEKLYELLKSRQLEAARAALVDEPGEHRGVEFVQDLYNPFYGGREFGIRDLNGYILNFLQP